MLTSLTPAAGLVDARLQELGLKSIADFQQSRGLTPDSIVGPKTQAALFAPSNPLLTAPLVHRCLALTGSFETSSIYPDCYAGLTGDFDGQGLSFGVVQWNIGQGTLQPLLMQMLAENESVMTTVFQKRLPELRSTLAASLRAQLAWARSIQDSRHIIAQPWREMLKTLGRTAEFQAIQAGHADQIHADALALCARFGVTSERATALMFDIRVQNYSINSATEAAIHADVSALPVGLAPAEIELSKLRSIANRRAEAATTRFIEDVRVRKLTIANGQGTVHGIAYDLERQFGISPGVASV